MNIFLISIRRHDMLLFMTEVGILFCLTTSFSIALVMSAPTLLRLAYFCNVVQVWAFAVLSDLLISMAILISFSMTKQITRKYAMKYEINGTNVRVVTASTRQRNPPIKHSYEQ